MKRRFLIIGNKNAITYKEVFPRIRGNEMWAGTRPWSGGMWFALPEDAEKVGRLEQDGTKMGNASAIWLTNIDHGKRHKPLQLAPVSGPYEKYDNYDAIEVPRTKDIPAGYAGVMGVPISFLDKYCPEQFEILDANDFALPHFTKRKPHGLVKDADGTINGKPKYARILIRHTAAARSDT